MLLGSTNPDSPAHWLKRDYLDRLDVLPNWRSWHFVLDDNIALSEEIKANLKANYTGLWYRRFIQGEWVAAEGAIFDMFDPKVGAGNVIEWADLPRMQELIAVSLDYGTTNPTAALLLGVSAEEDAYGRPAPRLFFIDEYRHDSKVAQQKLTDAELGREFVRWLNENHLPSSTPTRLVPRFTILDPSAASFSVELKKSHGITSTPADNDVLYGIRTMASLIAEKRLIVTTRCPALIRELPGYSWDPAATLKGEDKPLKVADHSTDAARYGITTNENIWRRFIKLAA